MKEPIIVGIAGGTASGKTTLAKKIKEEFKDDVIILSHDFYYKSYSEFTKAEREKMNYDCPDAYETDLLIEQINSLREGKTIERPIYSYVERLREEETVTVKPAPIIIIEGLLVLENQKLLNLMDLKVFVDTDADLRLIRLLNRDTKERGTTVEYITEKYKSTLKPMHEKYIEPCKEKADIIINGNDSKEIDKVIEKIKELKN